MELERPLVVLDLETTGTWIEKDRVVEVGMVKLSPGGGRETYVKRVNPEVPIPPFVSRLIGITDRDVAEAPKFSEIAEEVLSFIGEADIGGFNVERFDLPILERECFQSGRKLEWRNRTIFDAQKIYHFHEKRDLTAAYKFYCGKELVNAHSALGDTEATVEILAAQIGKYGKGDLRLRSLKDFGREPSREFYDGSRKFRWWNGELYPVFGKYARKYSVRQIAAKDPGYLDWLLTTDFAENTKAMLREAREGKFPAPKP